MKRFAIVTTAWAAVALGMSFNAGSANAAGGLPRRRRELSLSPRPATPQKESACPATPS